MGQGTWGPALFPLPELSQGTSRPGLPRGGRGDAGTEAVPAPRGGTGGTRAVPLPGKGRLGTAASPGWHRGTPRRGHGGTRTRKPEPANPNRSGSVPPPAGTHRAGPRRARRSRSRCLSLYRCRCPVSGASGCARCPLSGGDTLCPVFGAQRRQPVFGVQRPVFCARCSVPDAWCRCPASRARCPVLPRGDDAIALRPPRLPPLNRLGGPAPAPPPPGPAPRTCPPAPAAPDPPDPPDPRSRGTCGAPRAPPAARTGRGGREGPAGTGKRPLTREGEVSPGPVPGRDRGSRRRLPAIESPGPAASCARDPRAPSHGAAPTGLPARHRHQHRHRHRAAAVIPLLPPVWAPRKPRHPGAPGVGTPEVTAPQSPGHGHPESPGWPEPPTRSPLAPLAPSPRGGLAAEPPAPSPAPCRRCRGHRARVGPHPHPGERGERPGPGRERGRGRPPAGGPRGPAAFQWPAPLQRGPGAAATPRPPPHPAPRRHGEDSSALLRHPPRSSGLAAIATRPPARSGTGPTGTEPGGHLRPGGRGERRRWRARRCRGAASGPLAMEEQ
ncbi:basic proline-rich protein-like [Melospiza melodia melodia]|uniref:basic proline-rich protein-like n=1 Tax=Melospiza melodia melodia TaxID=1914991 RepID=UPI002FD2B0DF